MAYTDAHKIGDFLGRTLTTQQFAQATQLVPAVDAYINGRTGRSWLGTSPTTSELHVIYGPFIYLKNRPVTAVSSVNVRTLPTEDDTLLDADDYLLEDATAGKLYLGWTYYGYEARITYTHGGPVLPEDLALAATMLGAAWLGQHLSGASGMPTAASGIKSYSVGQDLSVTFFGPEEGSVGITLEVPPGIKELIDGYKVRSKVFA